MLPKPIVMLAAWGCTALVAAAEPRHPILWQDDFDGHGAGDASAPAWRLPGGAAVVVSDREGAGNCLHVPCPESRGFAEINVPVTVGRIYRAAGMVRCRDVTGPKGAVLYLQFSDAEQVHVNGGSFPRGLLGTHGWQAIEVHHTIPIPDNVAYVRVTVGVDGTGEAWFDELRLEEVTDWTGVEPLAPKDGETVRTALPELRWQPWSAVLPRGGDGRYSCELELSADAGFSGEGVVRVPLGVEAQAYRGEVALAPGVWHWRVTLSRGGVRFPPGGSARFEVAEDALVWPPRLVQDWSWSDAPRPELAVLVQPAAADVGEIRAWIGDSPAEILGPGNGRIRFRPLNPLPAGVHDVRVRVSPPEGEGAPAPVVLDGVFCSKQPLSRVSFREDGILLLDGKPVFPIGAYRDPSDREDVFDGLLEAGFDLTHSYRMDSHAIERPEERRRYLEAAHAHGIGVFLGMPRGMVRERRTAELARYVAETMDTPGLLAWYQFDEPEIQDCSPEDLLATYRAIRAVDPFHPKITLVCSIGFPVQDRFRRYAAGCDVFWEDPYPIPTKPLLMVEEKILACQEAAGPGKPVWCVIQGHSWEAWRAYKNLPLKNKGTRSEATVAAMKATGTIPVTRPNAVETRCMAHLAIAAGARGLVWYWSPNNAVHVKEDSPEVWNGIRETVRELREFMPWLLAEPTPGDTLRVPAPLRSWSRLARGERLVVLINPEDRPVQVPAAEMHELAAAFPGGPGDAMISLAPYEVRSARFRVAP
ncbi:MAG: hypothetical protein JXR77_02900 [Lentisphaeria bacterium]|nr:hypothetical protein [Lentisphaeria bacterium]